MSSSELVFYKALRDNGHSEEEALNETNMMSIAKASEQREPDITNKDLKIAILELEMKINNNMDIRSKEERQYADTKFDKLINRFDKIDEQFKKIHIKLSVGRYGFIAVGATLLLIGKLIWDLK
jgi:hypothetical protein